MVYPKVKVRDGDDRRAGALHDREWTCLLSLKDIQFLSSDESCSPVTQRRNVSAPLVAKISKPDVPNDVMPIVSISEAKEEKSDRKVEDEERPNIRVSSIPRPRAVLSSPDNDAVIGHKNRVKAERDSFSKARNLASNRYGRCKVISSNIVNESPVSPKKANDAPGDKSEPKAKTGSATSVASQRRNVRVDKRSPLSAYKPNMEF